MKVDESAEETEETDLETVELSNGGKSVWFKFIGFHKLIVFLMFLTCHLVEMGVLTNIWVFSSWYNWFW